MKTNQPCSDESTSASARSIAGVLPRPAAEPDAEPRLSLESGDLSAETFDALLQRLAALRAGPLAA